MKKFIDILAERIISIKDNDNNVYKGDFKIGYYRHKYSSSYKETLRLFLNGEVLTLSVPSKGGYSVTYKCSCGSINTIYLLKYLKKKEGEGTKRIIS